MSELLPVSGFVAIDEETRRSLVTEHTMLVIAPIVRGSSRFWAWTYAIAIVVDNLVACLPGATWMYLRHRWHGGCPAGASCRLLRIRVHVEVTS